MAITLTFHGDLAGLLRRQWRDHPQLLQAKERATSIKDMVESFGLPHTEVGRLLVDDREVDFGHLIKAACHIDIWPVSAPWQVLQPCLLRPDPLPRLRFLVDINVGKLASLLRMAGFDAALHPHLAAGELAACAVSEERLLLSKDRSLLMRKNIHFGRLIRATGPPEQLHEVITLLALHDHMRPLSRCLRCNTHLQPRTKKEIDHLLEPLTRKYYNDFSQCPTCAKLYWPGSHVAKMLALLPVRNPRRDEDPQSTNQD